MADRAITGRRWDLVVDFSALKPGDMIGTADLENLFGHSRDSVKFGLCLLSLISTAMAMRQDLYVDQHEQGFRVLTDEEAVTKGFRNTQKHLFGLQREHNRQQSRVNASKLPEPVKRAHESLVGFGASLAIQAQSDRRKLAVFARLAEARLLPKSSAPGLPAGDSDSG
jgi:hypothetical protein